EPGRDQRPGDRACSGVVGERLAGLAEEVARELVEEDDQADGFFAGAGGDIPRGRGGFRNERTKTPADLRIGRVRLLVPDGGSILVNVGRRAEVAHPEAMVRAEEGAIERAGGHRQNAVRWRIAADSVPSSR